MLDDSVIANLLDSIEPRIRSQLSSSSTPRRPSILGITGLQGAGKTTLASNLVTALADRGYSARTLSLDDLYLDHDHLVALRQQNPDNKLLRTRGQPGTHDEELAKWFFSQFDNDGEEILFPSFDKPKFDGEGDRVPKSQWGKYNDPQRRPLQVLVFEGWCVGFKPLPEADVEFKRESTTTTSTTSTSTTSTTSEEDERFSIRTLPTHHLHHLLTVNSNLKSYCGSFMGPEHFDYMVHLDTDSLRNAYVWRMQQEETLRKEKGTGMTDDGVVAFVRGYMPAYELYLEGLRDGFFDDLPEFGGKESRRDGDGGGNKAQMRIVLDRDRNVVEMQEMDFAADEEAEEEYDVE